MFTQNTALCEIDEALQAKLNEHMGAINNH